VTISILTIGLLIFGSYPNYDGDDVYLSKSVNILYQSTNRIVFSIALSYLIFACITSNGGFINDFLSWPIWVPLARLSYCVYLVHIYILEWFFLTSVTPIHFQYSITVS
jgi:peptidoglycan/LPS O-acetylase OafA/YrhL